MAGGPWPQRTAESPTPVRVDTPDTPSFRHTCPRAWGRSPVPRCTAPNSVPFACTRDRDPADAPSSRQSTAPGEACPAAPLRLGSSEEVGLRPHRAGAPAGRKGRKANPRAGTGRLGCTTALRPEWRSVLPLSPAGQTPSPEEPGQQPLQVTLPPSRWAPLAEGSLAHEPGGQAGCFEGPCSTLLGGPRQCLWVWVATSLPRGPCGPLLQGARPFSRFLGKLRHADHGGLAAGQPPPAAPGSQSRSFSGALPPRVQTTGRRPCSQPGPPHPPLSFLPPCARRQAAHTCFWISSWFQTSTTKPSKRWL